MTNFIERLEGLDLSRTTHRLKTATGMTQADCVQAETLYRQFLILKSKYPDTPITPPQLADEVWHEHITDTQAYYNDCEHLFGRFLHHIPDEDNQQTWQKAVHLYQLEFGVDVSGLQAGVCR
ncbi:glycine-rich domain-containing protein [Pseudoalteromonas galatheae]|uniref:glycine-rich domain-containing protein n=1 Tax=Pseudoalteromonas galatheae TaxID=579562 RepID=UPI0030CC373A